MTIFPFILDSRAAFLAGSGSLLLVPHGARTLLEHISSHVAATIQESATLLTSFVPDDPYKEAIRRTRAGIETIAPVEAFGRLLAGYEPSDWILLIDPRRYPAGGLDLHDFLARPPDAHAAHHNVSLEVCEQGTREYVQFDPAGKVRRIQRYYQGVTWLQASAVFCSIVSVTCLRLLERPRLASLLEVRGSLAACGVPSQDILLAGGTMDLHDHRDLLRLMEQGLRNRHARHPGATWRSIGPEIWATPSCRIDAGACLHGPLILQDNVSIEAGATVIGPALLGADSTVGARATVAQCLLLQQSVVPAGSTVYHGVIGPRLAESGQSAAVPLEAAPFAAAGMPLFAACPAGEPARHLYPSFKRSIDRVFALLGLILLSPLLVLTAVLLKLDSRGPPLFGHEREGKGGRLFRCWKFRTMIHGAHARQRELYARSGVDGPQFKLDNDPRITRIGWLLRKTNIDELPQLFNVLANQMSLIGPRPSPFRENQICIPWRQARLSVHPGITGLWQICRSNRAAGDFHQWIYYDMLYVRHMSLWLDLKILAATLVTFGGRWGVPVTWIIPARKLYRETRPWIISALEPPDLEGQTGETIAAGADPPPA